ncbi:hypothetical protein, partial [uncultured Spirosoma sp.]|uniref:hypothetical protein n=1 Tax=uncultured Spirosoma sp. TaxID=278208 RepID=UPI002611BE32
MAQPTLQCYRTSVLNGQSIVLACYSDGSTQRLSELPAGVTVSRKGGLIRLPYTPEAKGVYTPEQFGQDKYYSPTFRFCLDWNPGGKSVAERKRLGINCFNHWTLSDQDKAALPFGDGILYLTESGLHGDYEGALYYEKTLKEYEARIWSTMPSCGYGADAGVKLLIFNIEQSNGWSQGNYGANSHWPSWESSKSHVIVLESQTGSMTLEQLAATPGLMAQEEAVRRANRRIIMHKVAKAKGRPGLLTSDGSSMYQSLPRVDFADNSHGIFLDGFADVSKIGGSNGTITFTGSDYSRTYTGVSGSHWAQQDVMDGYYYLFDKDLEKADYQAIFQNKISETQNYPYLWGKIRPRHIVADEKGYIQLNRKRMQNRLGKLQPFLRQVEPQYEGDGIGLYVNGVYNNEYVNSRIPFADLQPTVTGNGEAPKVWQEPGMQYSRYIVTRFFAGNEADWGFYLFPPGDVSKVKDPLSATPVFNHHLHGITALFHARADLQPFERWFEGSTLVEDPEVQIGGNGSFLAYDGTTAYNYSDGKVGVQKPAFMLRWKEEGTKWRVLIMGGMNQGHTDERTDVIRVPGGLLNGNKFSVKLIGPYAHVFEVVVQKADIGQTYEVLPIVNTDWLRPGYAARTAASAGSGTGGDNGSSGGSGTVAINKPSFDTFDYSPILTNPTWSEYDTRLHRGVPIGDKIVLDNGIIRVEIWKNFGGAPGHISFSGQPNIINQNDWGRGTGMTIYRGGRTRQVEADNKEIQTQWAQAWGTTANGGGVGNNPIQIGDTFDNP